MAHVLCRSRTSHQRLYSSISRTHHPKLPPNPQHPRLRPSQLPSARTATNHATTSTPLRTMATSLAHATITPRPSAARGHANHGWLDSYHTFSFASYHSAEFTSFGALRVLNEDRVAPAEGFPTHPHRDAEIFSYIVSGELTHRDSLAKAGPGSDEFFVMKSGDVQFTTGGTGISHAEHNNGSTPVHFLQIWVLPWTRGLPPRYHTGRFEAAAKRAAFTPLISPLRAGPGASAAQEAAAQPALAGTIPIHADAVVGAAIVAAGDVRRWEVGMGAVRSAGGRRLYVHVVMAGKGGRVRLDGAVEVGEGDGAFVEGVDAGEGLRVEGVEGEAEVVVIDLD